jgi:SAM-dependent methyltransferase
LSRLIGALAHNERPVRWLDLACGPAWHLRSFPQGTWRVGLDASPAQLARARVADPAAHFVCADMASPVFAPRSFDLITSFWAGYCYLNSFGRIAQWLENILAWLRPGGAAYIEVLLPEDVATFNDSRYAAATGFRVYPRSADWIRWGYRDSGGEHHMTSPPLGFFTAPLALAFEHLEAEHDRAFMVHVIGTGRRDQPI